MLLSPTQMGMGHEPSRNFSCQPEDGSNSGTIRTLSWDPHKKLTIVEWLERSGVYECQKRSRIATRTQYLGAGFKYYMFYSRPLFGEIIQFDGI